MGRTVDVLPVLGWTRILTATAVAALRCAGELHARITEGPHVLMGHSLGARVMVTAAQHSDPEPGLPAWSRCTCSARP